MNKIRLIKIISAIIILLLFSLLIKKQVNQKNQNIYTGSDNTVFTGATDDIPLPENEQKILKQASDLREVLPIKEEKFELLMDYQKFKFVVTIYPPYSENKKAFQVWLVENGFEAIPQSEFEYVLNDRLDIPHRFGSDEGFFEYFC